MSDYTHSQRRFYTGMSLQTFGSLTEPAETQVLIKYLTSYPLDGKRVSHSYFYGINDLMIFLKRCKLHSPLIERAPRLDLNEIHPWDKYICRRQEFIPHKKLSEAVQLTWTDIDFQNQFMTSLIYFQHLQFLDICARGKHFVSGIVPTDLNGAELIVEQERRNCPCCIMGEPAIHDDLLSTKGK